MKVLACISFATAVVGMRVDAAYDPVFDYISMVDGVEDKHNGVTYLSLEDFTTFFEDAKNAGIRIP